MGKRYDQCKLLLCIKKKNAASFLGTIPQSPDLEQPHIHREEN
jgi:hypothetical protein